MAVRVFPVSPQATTKETRQAQARDERESVTLVVELEAPAPPTTTEGATGGKDEEEEHEEEEGGEGEPGPPITQLKFGGRDLRFARVNGNTTVFDFIHDLFTFDIHIYKFNNFSLSLINYYSVG